MALAQLAGALEYSLHLCYEVRSLPNECPGYDTKQSDGEVPEMLELWGMQNTPSFSSLLGQPWPWVVTSQIELFDIWTECKQMTYTKLNCLK